MNCPTGEICLAHICRPHMDFPAITDIIVKTASCHGCNHTSRVEEGLQVLVITMVIKTWGDITLPSGDPDWHLRG